MVPPHRRKRIFALALPIIGGMVSQNLLNLVDTLMVGQLGDAALAAVGLASLANFMSMAFITGLSAGVQAMAARRLGEGRHSEMAVPLNGGLLFAVALGTPLAVVLFLFAPELMGLLVDQAPVRELGTPYLQARLVALIAVGSNFAFRGYYNGVNLSRLYFRTLVVMHVCNAAFNYVLIFGALGFPALGVTGAGIGSAMATYVGTLTYVLLAFRHARSSGFLRAIPDRRTLVTMARVAFPTGLQQLLFALGMTAFFSIIGRVGTAELAASNVLLNLLLVAYLPGMGFGFASASLVGQALGKGEPEDARLWAWQVVRLAAVTMVVLALPGMLAPEVLLGAFLHDPHTLNMARLPLRMVAISIPIDAMGLVLMNSLQGAGDTRTVLVASTGLQYFVLLPAAYLLGLPLGLGLVGVWAAQVGFRSLQALVFAGLWRRGKWAQVQL